MNTISRCALLTVAIALSNSTAWAANAYPLFTDINASGPAFGVASATAFGDDCHIEFRRELRRK